VASKRDTSDLLGVALTEIPSTLYIATLETQDMAADMLLACKVYPSIMHANLNSNPKSPTR